MNINRKRREEMFESTRLNKRVVELEEAVKLKYNHATIENTTLGYTNLIAVENMY